jgi:UDP-N-acetylglucosamine:LPS N-acetylglucosamine transferase
VARTITLDFVYFDAGGGHRSAAIALQSVIASGGYDWRVRLVNLQEVLDSLDVFRKLTGIRLQDVYNLVLARGWTLGSAQFLRFMHGLIRMYHPAQVQLLSRFWEREQPDLVVSLVPNFNRALFQSLRQTVPGVPLVTILTDLADYPPHFWMERQPQYLVCGTQRATEQAAEMGHASSRVFRTSGMILRPEFYETPYSDRLQERVRLGLHPGLRAGLVLFGGEGSNVMYSMAERLGNSSIDLQLIMICGRNTELRRRLDRLKTRNTIFVEGFTKEIPYYMRLADFFIGKPGPGSISEAIQMGLPVIVERNAWTLPQERYNADWVRQQGVGVVLRNFRGIESAVHDLLASGRLGAMKTKIAALKNRAVFEIPPILKTILDETCAKSESPAMHALGNAGSARDELADKDSSRS